MRLIAVSDLHISGADDPLYPSLLKLIRSANHGDVLVLAGDVFDLFVGDKPLFMNRYREFFEELRGAGKRGTVLHYIEGNHDFLMSRALASIGGLTLHPEAVEFELGGRRFFVSHGDLVDRSDYGYRALRVFWRSPFFRAFVRVAPGNWIDGIGKSSSRYSRVKSPRLPSELPLERRERLRRIYRSFAAEKIGEGHDFVVMGHCHDLDEMSFQQGGHTGQYINVGFPRAHGSYLSWSPGDTKIQREKLP